MCLLIPSINTKRLKVLIPPQMTLSLQQTSHPWQLKISVLPQEQGVPSYMLFCFARSLYNQFKFTAPSQIKAPLMVVLAIGTVRSFIHTSFGNVISAKLRNGLYAV